MSRLQWGSWQGPHWKGLRRSLDFSFTTVRYIQGGRGNWGSQQLPAVAKRMGSRAWDGEVAVVWTGAGRR